MDKYEKVADEASNDDVDFFVHSTEDEYDLLEKISALLSEEDIDNIVKAVNLTLLPNMDTSTLIDRLTQLIGLFQVERDIDSIVNVLELLDVEMSSYLLIVVKSSGLKLKNITNIELIAARAMTILNTAKISFSGMDLSDVFIDGADLSDGIFNATQFKSAKLKNIRFSGALLNDANFKNAQMEDIDFGELPMLFLNNPTACLYSLDGRHFAIANAQFITMYESSTKKLVCNLVGHQKQVTAIAFSPSSRLLASGSRDGSIRLWDLKNYVGIKIFIGHTDSVTEIIFSSNNQHFFSASKDGTINIWQFFDNSSVDLVKNLNSSIVKELIILDQFKFERPTFTYINGEDRSPITSLAFSPDANVIAFGDYKENIKIWDPKSRKVVKTIEKINAERKQPSGPFPEIIETLIRKRNYGGERIVFSLQFSPTDPNLLASASGDLTFSYDTSIKLWDVKHACLLRELQGHTLIPYCIVFSRDGKQLVSGSKDHSVKLWNVFNGTLIKTFGGHLEEVLSISYSANDEIASVSQDGSVKFWTNSVKNLQNDIKFDGHSQAVLSVSFCSKGELLASGSDDGTIKIWRCNLGKIVKSFEKDAFGIKGHSLGVNSVAFSQNNQILASGGVDRRVILWNIENGNCYMVLDVFRESVESVIFSPKAYQLVAGANDGTITLWNFATENYSAIINKLNIKSDIHVYNIAYSPDGQQLVSSGMGLKLLEVSTLKISKEFSMIVNSWSVVFLPDGKHFLAGGGMGNRDINLWSIDKSAVIATFKGHMHGVTTIALLAQNQFVSASEDGTLRLWNIPLKSCIGVEKFNTTIRGISVIHSSGGIFLATGSMDNAVSYWHVLYQSQIQVKLRLFWSSRTGILLTENANFDGVEKLSSQNILLLKQNKAINIPSESILMFSENPTEIGRKLRQNSAKSEVPADSNYHELVKKAIVLGMHLGQSSNGNTALHWAFINDQFDKAIILLEEIDQRSKNAFEALQIEGAQNQTVLALYESKTNLPEKITKLIEKIVSDHYQRIEQVPNEEFGFKH